MVEDQTSDLGRAGAAVLGARLDPQIEPSCVEVSTRGEQGAAEEWHSHCSMVRQNSPTKESYASEGHWCIDAMLGGVA